MQYSNTYFRALAAILTLNASFALAQNQDPSQPAPPPPSGDVPITSWSPPHYPSRKYNCNHIITLFHYRLEFILLNVYGC